jgi:2,3-bisphosphoglycerate-independent phosphoglycerate mutase
MKYVILLGDGMGDYPLAALGHKTPLQYAHTPHMDRLAQKGTLGLVETIPPGFAPGSDVANIAVLGYNPAEVYSGRAPLEAASMGISLGPDDVAFRCNLVSLGEGNKTMDDFTAGHITSLEAEELIRSLQEDCGDDSFTFYPGVGYRHLLVWRGGSVEMKTTPPHDITGQQIDAYQPAGHGGDLLRELMERARSVLRGHSVNQKRLAAGKKEANAIWLWGQGKAPAMTPLTEKYGIRGGVISAVDLLNGLGICAGLDVIHVEGITGYIDTNYRGKAEAALDCIRERDFVFVHVEAPDEMGHEGNMKGKIRAIEDFDAQVVGTVLEGLSAFSSWRLLVLPDHPTPLALRTHASDPCHFAVLSSHQEENLQNGQAFSEEAALLTGIRLSPGYGLMDSFIGDWRRFLAS